MVFVNAKPLLALTALAATIATSAAAPRVDPAVHRTLREQGSVNLIVTMKASPKETLNSAKEGAYVNRGAKIAAIVDSLSKHAKTTQADIDAIFSQEAASTTPLFTSQKLLWVSNQRFIEGASAELLTKLSGLSSVAEIRVERQFKVPTVFPASVNATTEASTILANEWGVTKIGAPTIWAAGNTGKGIVVSSIDTGVLGTHEALKANYRGSYGWYDPEAKKSAPYDNNGHGSHTMGTIAGAGGIGVAPGATWMACKGCRTDSCPESDLLACAQFITCPTDTAGANKDCSKAPHLVSNSWGGGQGDSWYQSSVDAWRAAGIIPIFANGNSGPACTTVNSPGDYKNVIGVGATDSGDALASFSSKGPSTAGTLKPEVSAPGYNVRSAWYTSATAYNTISGTSMATPHVSGVVALLLAAKPGLTYDQVRSALITGVDTTTLVSAGYTCGGTKDGVFPNNNFGYGRVNAVKIVGTSTTPAPTTVAPVTPAPTTVAPVPTSTPAPTTKAPTPAPTVSCTGLGSTACKATGYCYWSWWYGCY